MDRTRWGPLLRLIRLAICGAMRVMNAIGPAVGSCASPPVIRVKEPGAAWKLRSRGDRPEATFSAFA
ncbi:hypothetical protein ACFT7S_12180 [Streptomyces sp. NPDC057136]|uniref:hypothetical protein n=1 Tax=Streptomyces sp. NPDC057136 TaxID=3346029 RepID=UPI00362B795F